MQTLNVGAGRNDEEYKAAEEQRRTDLRAESRSAGFYFFVAAVLAGIGSGLFLVRVPIFVTIGAIELLMVYGRPFGDKLFLVVYGSSVIWAAALVGLGFAAQKGYRWAFWAGIVLYGADMIALAITFSIWSLGVHAFLIFKWFQGQKALQDLQEVPVSKA
jgi:hypothetical protein